MKLQTTIVFNVGPTDRCVGIMSEGFSAWDAEGEHWCELVYMSMGARPGVYRWFSNDTGDEINASSVPKSHRLLVEAMLDHYAHTWYAVQEDER